MTDVERNAILGNVQRQYVGARYVPKFFQGPDGTPTWVGNVPYEALTIVTYLGNSYTSKVPVPAGIGNPSQNPTYWALTGNFNAQLEGIYGILNGIPSIYKKPPKKYYFIGDSYANPEYSNWCANIIGLMGLGQNGIDAHVSGGSFFNDYWYNNMISLSNNMSDEEKNDVAAICVLGGVNECISAVTDFDVVEEKMSNFIIKMKQIFPRCTVYIGFIGVILENGYSLNGRTTNRLIQALNIYSRCEKYGAIFIPNMEFSTRKYDDIRTDGVHPLAPMGPIIAQYAYNAIRGGLTPDIIRTENSTKPIFNNNLSSQINNTEILPVRSSGAAGNVSIFQHNNITQINFMCKIRFNFKNDYGLNESEQFKIGECNFALWNGRPGNNIIVQGTAYKNSGDNYPVRIAIALLGNSLYAIILNINNGSSSPTMINYIIVDPFNISLPTMQC